MKLRPYLPAAVFLLLGAAAVTGLVRTSAPAAAPVHKRPAKADTLQVDQGPILTARRLATLASSPEDRQFAHDAQRVADHEVDLAFADALRQAAGAAPPATPAIRALLERRKLQDEAVDEGARNVARLGKALAAAKEQEKDALEDQLEVAKAQLELDKDELDATSEQLERQGADPAATIRRVKAAFSAQEAAPAPGGPDLAERFQPGSLLHRLGQWSRLHRKRNLLGDAREEALAKAEELNQRQQALAKDVEQEAEDRQAAREQARGFSKNRAVGDSRATAKATLLTLKHFMEDQRTLADLGKRYQDEKELAAIYLGWSTSAAVEERAALHGALQRATWILGVLTLIWFAEWIFEGIFRAMLAGRKRVGRNLKVVKFSAQAVGVLAIVLIVLGVPGQLTTLFGLAGAGLTVALKDFIISFFGWFVLVGPKGIHVGDWVEIRGVGGEVIEIGLMRTLLLETGNWSDAAHPTGRVVSFVNSFAMEGHFFNFSSAGQWMWDELTVTAPAGQDPYPFIDGIKALVETKTGANAALAFKEWEASERGGRTHALKAEAGINVVPTSQGVEIHMRYVTRAQDRQDLRRELNEAVVEMLHGKRD